MLRFFVRLLAGGALWCAFGISILFGQTAAKAPVQGATVEGITEYQLANGLRVLLFPDPSKPTITVNITYLVGSRNENYGETGMAHLLEHLLFKGTPTHPDVYRELSEHGARSNGQTSFDRTNYFETFQAGEANLKWALDMEADRMVHSFIGVDPEKAAGQLKSEMTVVRNEYESGENEPGSVLYKRLLEAAYDWHNYGKPTIGARSDIENVDIQRLSAFYKTYYQPDNAVLLVAGRFEPVQALKLVEATFGRLPRPARKIQPTYTVEPTQDGERQVVVRRAGDVQMALAAYHVPSGSDPDFASLSVLARIMGDDKAGRLHKALVETGKAVAVFAHAMPLKDPSLILFGVDVRSEASLADAKDLLLKTVETPGGLTFSPEDVERAKRQLLTDIDLMLNDADHVGISLSNAIAMGDWRLFFLQRDRIKAVTPQDVERVAKAYLKPSNRTLGLFMPEAHPDRAEIPVAKDIEAMVKGYKGQVAVAQGEAFDSDPMAIEARTIRFETSGGLRMALVPKKTRGASVNFRLVLRLGDEKALEGKATVGNLAAEMLMRGTLRHTKAQLDEELDRLKAKLRVGGSAEAVMASGETTRENLPKVLDLVAEILKEPAFPGKELEMLKEEALADQEQERSDPSALGQLAFERHLSPYPKGHPRYVGTLDEDAEEVKAATLDQVKTFHKAFYGASSAELVVVGDFEPKAVEDQVASLFDPWRSPAPYTRMPRKYKDAGPLDQVLQTPDKANAFFMAGLNLPLQTTDADYPALVLGDYMLGGGFLNSRLATRIRQKEGLSYSVGSDLQAAAREKAGLWMAYAIYAPQNRDRLEKAFRDEMERVLKEGFSAEEIQAAKKGWLEEQRLSRSQDKELAVLLGMDLDVRRTMAYTADLERKVQALSGEQVLAALRRYLDLSKLTEVKAGDFSKVK